LSLPRIKKIEETRTYEMRPIRMHKIHHLAGSFVVCANLLRNSTTMIYTIFFVTHNFSFKLTTCVFKEENYNKEQASTAAP
jgi:hypothetical protein